MTDTTLPPVLTAPVRDSSLLPKLGRNIHWRIEVARRAAELVASLSAIVGGRGTEDLRPVATQVLQSLVDSPATGTDSYLLEARAHVAAYHLAVLREPTRETLAARRYFLQLGWVDEEALVPAGKGDGAVATRAPRPGRQRRK